MTACGSAAEAVTGAGLVVTATSSAIPVLERAWLADGTHINAVGACLPHQRELDSATMAAAAVFADSRESALAESGDVRLAIAEQAVPPVHIRAEIGELLSGTALGRASDREITVFESLGLAAEDLAAAQGVYRNAVQDRGRDLGGLLSAAGRSGPCAPAGRTAAGRCAAALDVVSKPGRPAEWGTSGDNGDRGGRRLARGVLLRRGRTRPADRGPRDRGGRGHAPPAAAGPGPQAPLAGRDRPGRDVVPHPGPRPGVRAAGPGPAAGLAGRAVRAATHRPPAGTPAHPGGRDRRGDRGGRDRDLPGGGPAHRRDARRRA